MSRSSCAISSLRVTYSFSRISVGKIHLSFSWAWRGSHGFVTASLVRTQQPISRGSLGVQWLDILLLHPCFNTFSRGFLAASWRNVQDGDFSLFALCSTAFLIVANGISRRFVAALLWRFPFALHLFIGARTKRLRPPLIDSRNIHFGYAILAYVSV